MYTEQHYKECFKKNKVKRKEKKNNPNKRIKPLK